MKAKIKKCIIVTVLSLLALQAVSTVTAVLAEPSGITLCSDKDSAPFNG